MLNYFYTLSIQYLKTKLFKLFYLSYSDEYYHSIFVHDFKFKFLLVLNIFCLIFIFSAV